MLLYDERELICCVVAVLLMVECKCLRECCNDYEAIIMEALLILKQTKVK